MEKKFSKALGLLLALCMVLAVLPAAALAAEEPDYVLDFTHSYTYLNTEQLPDDFWTSFKIAWEKGVIKTLPAETMDVAPFDINGDEKADFAINFVLATFYPLETAPDSFTVTGIEYAPYESIKFLFRDDVERGITITDGRVYMRDPERPDVWNQVSSAPAGAELSVAPLRSGNGPIAVGWTTNIPGVGPFDDPYDPETPTPSFAMPAQELVLTPVYSQGLRIPLQSAESFCPDELLFYDLMKAFLPGDGLFVIGYAYEFDLNSDGRNDISVELTASSDPRGEGTLITKLPSCSYDAAEYIVDYGEAYPTRYCPVTLVLNGPKYAINVTGGTAFDGPPYFGGEVITEAYEGTSVWLMPDEAEGRYVTGWKDDKLGEIEGAFADFATIDADLNLEPVYAEQEEYLVKLNYLPVVIEDEAFAAMSYIYTEDSYPYSAELLLDLDEDGSVDLELEKNLGEGDVYYYTAKKSSTNSIADEYCEEHPHLFKYSPITFDFDPSYSITVTDGRAMRMPEYEEVTELKPGEIFILEPDIKEGRYVTEWAYTLGKESDTFDNLAIAEPLRMQPNNVTFAPTQYADQEPLTLDLTGEPPELETEVFYDLLLLYKYPEFFLSNDDHLDLDVDSDGSYDLRLQQKHRIEGSFDKIYTVLEKLDTRSIFGVYTEDTPYFGRYLPIDLKLDSTYSITLDNGVAYDVEENREISAGVPGREIRVEPKAAKAGMYVTGWKSGGAAPGDLAGGTATFTMPSAAVSLSPAYSPQAPYEIDLRPETPDGIPPVVEIDADAARALLELFEPIYADMGDYHSSYSFDLDGNGYGDLGLEISKGSDGSWTRCTCSIEDQVDNKDNRYGTQTITAANLYKYSPITIVFRDYELEIIKTWDDAGNTDKRPDGLEVTAQMRGRAPAYPLCVPASTYSFVKLASCSLETDPELGDYVGVLGEVTDEELWNAAGIPADEEGFTDFVEDLYFKFMPFGTPIVPDAAAYDTGCKAVIDGVWYELFMQPTSTNSFDLCYIDGGAQLTYEAKTDAASWVHEDEYTWRFFMNVPAGIEELAVWETLPENYKTSNPASEEDAQKIWAEYGMYIEFKNVYDEPEEPEPDYYKVTVLETENGTAKANKAEAEAGATVKITATPDEGYELDRCYYTREDDSDVMVPFEGSFKMPAADVLVKVTFKAKSGGGGSGSGGGETVDKFFDDVEKDDWFYDAVKYVFEKGMMNGVGDNKFDPDGTTTRAMVVTILYRLEGEPEVDAGTSPFFDVAPEAEGFAPQWYTKAVLWAAENGIVEGYVEGAHKVFDPNGSITREQLAAILYRYEQYKGGGFTGAWYFPLDFEDAADVSDWADEAMHWCVMKGVITGVTETTLVPGGSATRAQAATMLMRFSELEKD